MMVMVSSLGRQSGGHGSGGLTGLSGFLHGLAPIVVTFLPFYASHANRAAGWRVQQK